MCECKTCQEAGMHFHPETKEQAALRQEVYYDYYDAYLDYKDFDVEKAFTLLKVATRIRKGHPFANLPDAHNY